MSSLDLYNYIVNKYGKRSLYISDLAAELNISHRSARLLVQALGYHRTKRTTAVQYNTFATSKAVNQILPKITIT